MRRPAFHSRECRAKHRSLVNCLDKPGVEQGQVPDGTKGEQTMRINDELSRPVLVHAAKMDWVASPSAGVDRRMLFRIGDEVARATSVVRYARGSVFPRHTHGGGEEILVLEGVFQDEHGDYPAGTYFRNPPGTSHVPASKDGCTIFVRLWQFRDGDRMQIVRRPGQGQQVEPRPGAIRATVLFDDGHEQVRGSNGFGRCRNFPGPCV